MVLSPVWRRRPVYVTSALRDMGAEREYLHTSVFPDLAERLRARGQHLEPIDLRYGVTVETPEDEQCKELSALKVCLAELGRTRPLCIVLLGDRYGWVPPEDRARAVVEEGGFRIDVTGKSVTALEIESGLLGLPEQERCLFYFREPLDYDQMPEEVAASYRDGQQAQKLAELKQRIEREMPDRVRRYRVEWDEENQTVTGLDEWGRMVLEDLWQALDHETQACVEMPPPTWQDEQRWLLRQCVETHGSRFVGRAAVVDRLLGLARSSTGQDQPWGACVTGGSGAGKTALFSHLYCQLQEDDVLLLGHAAGISVLSTQVDSVLGRWTSELAQALGIDGPVGPTSTSREVEESFGRLLSEAAQQRRVVLLIDGLDQFEATPRAQRLAWLPKAWPENARLIATSMPGTPSEALERLPGVGVVPLPPVEPNEAREIAEAVCARYHRPLDPELFDVLLSKSLPGGVPAVGTPLWLELAIEEMNLLDADDCAEPGGKVSGASQEQFHQLMLDVAHNMPPNVEALCQWMLGRNEERFGAGWVAGLVNLVAVSRNGLRESDLKAVLPKVVRLLAPTAPREAWDGLKFALLRRAFRAHLTQRGTDGGWDFSHPQLRQTIHRRNLRDPQLVQRLHTGVAYHLKSLPSSDPLRQTELMVHLIGSEDRLRAAHYYAGDLPEEELAGATQALADYILAGSTQSPNVGLGWAVSLLIEPKLQKSQVAALCRRYNVDLLERLKNNAPTDARRRIADATRKAAEEQLEQDPDNAQWRQSLVTSCQRLATFQEEAGSADEAKDSWRRCHETLCALREADVPLDPSLDELLEELERRLEALK